MKEADQPCPYHIKPYAINNVQNEPEIVELVQRFNTSLPLALKKLNETVGTTAIHLSISYLGQRFFDKGFGVRRYDIQPLLPPDAATTFRIGVS